MINKDAEEIEMLGLTAAYSRISASVVRGSWLLDRLRILEQTIERRWPFGGRLPILVNPQPHRV
ncbi:MAG: hypothetical protein DMF70_05460 [Acidobacteria bacterium]|nr:MAG: hypothetical protein DMF70_05460 [Acidobacteriota bacterium]